MKNRAIILLIIVFNLSLISQAADGEIFRWVDDKGGVHFTEDPVTIPEQFKDRVRTGEMPDSPNQTPSPTNRDRRYSSPSPLSQKQIIEPPATERKALTEYEINAFVGRYATVQHDEYTAGSYTAKSLRKGDPLPKIGERCRSILERCFDFNEREFKELVERHATYVTTEYAPGSRTTVIHEQGEIIPERIPSLLQEYCGGNDSAGREPSSASTRKDEEIFKTPPDMRERMYPTHYGYHNPQTGAKWHKNYDRLHNPVTGESLIKTDYGYYNPKTGEKWYTTIYGLIKSNEN
jgi:hypothetical protein